MQTQRDGSERPIAFRSRTLSARQRSYQTREKEMLSAVEAFDDWRVYLSGRQFIWRTDHEALKWARTLRYKSRKIQRWLAEIADLDFVKDRLFFGADGELCITTTDPASPGGLLVLPGRLVPSMLDAFHDKIAHPGTASTAESIQRLFWWPSVNKDVTDYIRSCGTCATRNPTYIHAFHLPK